MATCEHEWASVAGRWQGTADYCVRCGLDRYGVRRAVDLESALAAMKDRAERAELQLAGCGVAALGGVEGRAPVAVKGDYGWSASYQDVVDLRVKYEAEVAAHAQERALTDALVEALPKAYDVCGVLRCERLALWFYDYGGVHYRCDEHKREGFAGFSEPYEVAIAAPLRAIAQARAKARAEGEE